MILSNAVVDVKCHMITVCVCVELLIIDLDLCWVVDSIFIFISRKAIIVRRRKRRGSVSGYVRLPIQAV